VGEFAGAAGYLNPWGDARVGDGNGRARSPTALPDGQHTIRFLVDLALGSVTLRRPLRVRARVPGRRPSALESKWARLSRDWRHTTRQC